MASEPDNSAPRPLYQRVKDYVLDHIESGELAPGHRLPSEHELVRMLGVSRMTANRALRELMAEGALTRLPGVGTFVAPRPADAEFLRIRNIADEVAERGHVHRADRDASADARWRTGLPLADRPL
jgi:GntR family histidine utilization transcriptional repressor